MSDLPAATVPDEGHRGGFLGQVSQYPKNGAPGIGYFRGVVDIGTVTVTDKETGNERPAGRVLYEVDNLLYRNSKGQIIGILQFFSEDAPMDLEKAGNLNVFVHPRRQRRGIAMALLVEADKRWGPLNMHQQMFTTSGRALAEAWERRKSR